MTRSISPWRLFFTALKQEQLHLNDEQRIRFSRARARLRIAKRFQGINLSGVSSATERGYTTGLAIFLAYSGMEALAGAMGEPVRTWQLEDPTLARSLNRLLSGVDLSHPNPKEGIGWLLDGHQLLGKLQKFQAGESHDVFLITQGLRHMVAHGAFTTHGLKMFTKRECDAVEQLRQRIFLVCDERLHQWLVGNAMSPSMAE